MRARSIKPGIAENDVLAECGGPMKSWVRLLFAMLPMMADKAGRLEDRPKKIAAQLFPYDDEIDGTSVSGLLSDLEQAGFIERYAVDGKAFIQIVNFLKHQKPHQEEKPSVIPPNPGPSIIVPTIGAPTCTQGVHEHAPPIALVSDCWSPTAGNRQTDSPSSSVGVPTATPSVPEPQPPIARAMADEAEVARRFARYDLDPNADANDKATLREVMAHVTANRLTGEPLHITKRLKILDRFARFETEVVYRACHTFKAEGLIGSAKDAAYLDGICEGSATSETIESRQERGKRERDELRQTRTGTTGGQMGTRNPTPIGGLLVSAMRLGES